jgi:hypothetical protein
LPATIFAFSVLFISQRRLVLLENFLYVVHPGLDFTLSVLVLILSTQIFDIFAPEVRLSMVS